MKGRARCACSSLTMRHLSSLALFAALALTPLGSAAETKAPAKAKRAPNPAFAPVTDVAGLPRVLLIGDSISMGYTVAVRELLQGKANVHRIPTNGGPTSRGVESIDAWLGDGKWDVIHFNFGLHDLVYMGPDGSRLVDPKAPGSKHQVPLPDYEKNLTQIVAKLKATGAKVIWCNTTPVPEGSPGRVGDEALQFNAAADRVMSAAGVPTNDLHSHAKARLTDIQLPANVHFTPDGSKFLAEKVAAEIAQALKP